MIFIVKPIKKLVGHPDFGKAEFLLSEDGRYAKFESIESAESWLENQGAAHKNVFFMELKG